MAIDDPAFRAEIESGSFLAELDALISVGAVFDIMLFDPAWRFKTYSKQGLGRSADRHYPTMNLAEIMALGPRIRKLAAKDCTGCLWTTWPQEACGNVQRVFDAWGFKGKTCLFDWIKITKKGLPALGTGFYTRANSEPCLLATRGKPLKRFDRGISQIIMAPRRRHSQKPDEAYDRIERLFGPHVRRLELFARAERPGWTTVGTTSDRLPAPGLSDKRLDQVLGSRGAGPANPGWRRQDER
ncbi:DNA methyltransferase [Nordella sp. HKS 07]|uniref:MT-A70 family methyltransferase n=1 Tax=Nordella sp. HKS 07 TaxID=2712222 RepID=UPI0013E11B07|nr:MT-A70 family methyltransferase [Nordella sp. HKS 07]QIG50584.1 DNA methyltransferase [Nordella sp. HKS 07]